ncbi:MAG: polysaccharide biosynthesis C-terminal domain-containing protein, partial [Bacteroidota bacterium]
LFYALLIRAFGWLRPRLKIQSVAQVIRLSWGFALMTILYSLHDKVDQVMLERLFGEAENGLYAAAYRWLDAFSMYLWTILPFFFARFAFFLKEPQEQEKLLHYGQIVTAVPMIFVGVFVWFHGEQLLFLFDQSTPAELETIRLCLQALFLAGLMNGIFAIFSTLLTSTGHEKKVNYMVLASILLNVGLNFWLIPQYGAIAAAWSTVISYALVNALYLVYIQQHLSIQIPWLQMLKLSVAGMALFGAFWGMGQLGLSWWQTSLIAGAAYLLFCYLIGLISWRLFKAF